MTSVSDIDKELIRLLFLATKNRKFTEDIWSRFKTDNEKNDMIYYLQNCVNPSIHDINYRALEIVTPRWEAKEYKN